MLSGTELVALAGLATTAAVGIASPVVTDRLAERRELRQRRRESINSSIALVEETLTATDGAFRAAERANEIVWNATFLMLSSDEILDKEEIRLEADRAVADARHRLETARGLGARTRATIPSVEISNEFITLYGLIERVVKALEHVRRGGWREGDLTDGSEAISKHWFLGQTIPLQLADFTNVCWRWIDEHRDHVNMRS